MKALIDQLESKQILMGYEFTYLLSYFTQEDSNYLFEKARKASMKHYGKKIYIRGLIEFSNYCKNNCFYCGIRYGNQKAIRYRLGPEEILSCCQEGYALGFRTFVLQSGEDPYFQTTSFASLIQNIRERHPDCAITLSIGERSYEEYKTYFKAGADRFLLRHETADPVHYRKLHPGNLSSKNRKRCLLDLKEIGYQVGTGFMVGSPWQTNKNLAEDLLFIKELEPDMIGIGPYITHKDTPFANFHSGSFDKTLFLIGLLRLMMPNALIPATTALGTIHPSGREMGILAGANVVMPNLSPLDVRKKYELYDNKICTGDEAAQCIACLEKRMEKINYEIVVGRGDPAPKNCEETKNV